MYGDDLISIKAPASPSGETGASTVNVVIGSYTATFSFTYEVPITSAGTISFVQPLQASIGDTMSIVVSNFNRINSATDVGVTVGPATATVKNIATNGRGDQVILVTVPAVQIGQHLITVRHAQYTTNTASHIVDISGAASDPYLVSSYPGVIYDQTSNQQLSVTVAGLTDTRGGLVQLMDITVWAGVNNSCYDTVVLDNGRGSFTITATVPLLPAVPVRSANGEVGILTIRSFTPPILLPFKIKILEKPKGAAVVESVATSRSFCTPSTGCSLELSYGEQEIVTVVLSNFQRATLDRVGVMMGQVSMTVLSVASDTVKTVVVFQTRSTIAASAVPRSIRISSAENPGTANDASFLAKVADKGFAVIASVFPSVNATALPIVVTVKISNVPSSTGGVITSPSVKFNGNRLIPLARVQTQHIGNDFYAAVTIDQADIVVGSVIGSHFIEFDHPSFTVAAFAKLRANFRIDALAPRIFAASPSSGPTGVAGQLVTLTGRNFSASATLFLTVQVSDGFTSQTASIVSGFDTLLQGSNVPVSTLVVELPDLSAAGTYAISITSTTNAFAAMSASYTVTPVEMSVSASPRLVSATGGASVTLTVSNYPLRGGKLGRPVVTIGGVQVAVSSINEIRQGVVDITFVAPPASPASIASVVVSTRWSSYRQTAFTTLTYSDLIVESISTRGSTSVDPMRRLVATSAGGATFTFRIKDVALAASDTASITFGGMRGSIISITRAVGSRYTQVEASAPMLPATELVQSRLTLGSSAFPFVVSFVDSSSALQITNIFPDVVGNSLNEKVQLTLIGLNNIYADTDLNNYVVVEVAGVPAVQLALVSASEDSLTFTFVSPTLAADGARQVPVIVRFLLQGSVAVSSIFVSNLRPYIVSVSPETPTVGQAVEIQVADLPPVTSKFQLGLVLGGLVSVAPQALLSSIVTSYGTMTSLKVQIPANAPVVGSAGQLATLRIGVIDLRSGSANVLPGMPTTTVVVNTDSVKRAEFVTPASIEKLGTTTSIQLGYVMNGASVANTYTSTIGGVTTVAVTNLANTTISTQYPTFGSGTRRQLLNLDVPMLAKSLTSTSIGTVQGRIVEKNAATGAFTSIYYDLDVLDKDFSNVVERVTPSSVDVYGGSLVTVTIYKFNNGIAVTAAQTRVLFGTSEATVISAISTSTRTTITFVAPASENGLATGFVVPSIGNAVSFSLLYVPSCDYNALCGPQGIIASLIEQQPPSAMMCSTKYCSSRYDLPELQYATKSAYTGVRSKVRIGVKNVASLRAQDLEVVFNAGGVRLAGTVESVVAVGPTLAEISVVTPYIEVPQVMTMSLQSIYDATGYSSVSSSFTFYDRPTGSSVVAISPAQGSMSGGTTVTVTVSNFPVISFATEVRVRFVVGASATVANSVRLVRSDYQSTVLLVTSPIAAAAGANLLEVSYLDNSIFTNIGSSSWTYQAAEQLVVNSFPSSGPISGGFELLAVLQGFPVLSAAADVNFTFNGFTVVSGSTLIYSSALVSKVKVVVPAADIGAVAQPQQVRVQHSSLDGIYAWFSFTYTIVDRDSVRVTDLSPSSTPVNSQAAVKLYIANFPTVSNLTEIMVTFGNLPAPVLSAVKSGTSTVLTVNSPLPNTAGTVTGTVYQLRNANRAGSVGTFQFTYTQPAITIEPAAGFGGGSVKIVVPSPGTNAMADWSVSFGATVATIVSAQTSGATTEIQVVSPASSTAQTVQVAVVFVPQRRTWTIPFSFYIAPSVSSILPRRKAPGVSQVFVTIRDFPIVRTDQLRVAENGSPVQFEVTRSDSEATVVKVTTIGVGAPVGVGSGSMISILPEVESLRVAFNWVYTADLSVVSSSTYIGSTLGGETVTVVARFPTIRQTAVAATDVAVRFGDHFGEVVQVAWQASDSTATITVTTPSIAAGSYQLEVAVGDATATSATDFVFAGTFSSAISTTTAIGVSTASTTVLGLYSFGAVGPTDALVTVGPSYPAAISSVTGVTLTSSDVDPCATANDGICDVPSSCSDGDFVDCKVRRAFVVAPSKGRVGSVASAVLLQAGTNTVAKSVAVNNAPGILSATYDAGRATIRVTFDMATNRAGMTSTLPDCSLVVVGDFGSGSACVWESASVLVIMLGYGVNWLPGAVIQLADGKLRAEGGFSAAASASFGLGDSLIVKSPRVGIEAPARISPCADLRLSAIGTLRGANLEYFWTCTNDATLDAYLSVNTVPKLTVPNAYLRKTEYAYKIALTARIRGTTALTNLAEATVYRSGRAEATATIRGQSVVKVGSSIDLSALLEHSECPVSATTVVTFSWTIDQALNSTAVNRASPYISVPTTALTALQSYSFTLTTQLGTDETSVRTTQFTVSVVAASATPSSTIAPTRGRCFVAWAGESTISVRCDDFHDPSGSDVLLRYEFGYFNAAGWHWFGPSVDFSDTYCVPSGAFEPWVRVTSSSGVSAYSKAVWSSSDLPVTFLSTVASLSSSSVSFGGISTNTVMGKYQTWGLLGRQDLLSQCVYVWASDPPSASSSSQSADSSSLTSYMYTASGAIRLADPTLATPVLQATGRLSKFQHDLAASLPGTAINTAIAATLCSLSSVAKFAAEGLPLTASLDAQNVTGALQTVASIAQSNKFAVASGVATANSSCAVTVNSDFYAIQQATAMAIAAAGDARVAAGAADMGAIAVFAMQGVSGTIRFSQSSVGGTTTVRLDLSGLNANAKQYHIHVNPINSSLPTASSCSAASVGGHFKNQIKSTCNPAQPETCEYGDLSGKFEELTGLSSIAKEYTTSGAYLPLSGADSIIGRSIVIHDTTGARWVCANIVAYSPSINLYHGLSSGSAVSIDVFKVANNSAYTVSSGAASGPGFFSLKTVPANWAFTNAMISAGVFGYSLSGSNLVVDVLMTVDKALAGVTTLSAATVSCTAYSNGAWVRESTCKAIVFGSTTVTCRCTGGANDVLVQFFDVAAATLGCDGVAGSGRVPDACGVCGGTNSTCTGCDGVVNSRKVADACGVCGGTNSTCVGCDGIPNSGVGLDVCSVCGGDGTSCLGCAPADGSAPLPLGAGGLTFDRCGVCGGNGSSCVGCDNVPYSKKKFDACGICGGTATKRGCVSAFVTPAEGARFAVTSGTEITVSLTASASDNDGSIRLGSFTPGASYQAYSLSSVQTDGVITATFRWTPSQSGSYPLCVNLYSKSSTISPVQQGSRCVTIEVTFCEVVAQSGDTLSTISQKEFGDAQYWRTLWWLNPAIAYREQPLASGTRVSIGRVFTVQGNNTVEYYINRFGGSFGKLVEKNPLKLDYLQGGRNYVANQIVARSAGAAVVDVVYKDFERRITYDGVQYCIVSQMDSYQRA